MNKRIVSSHKAFPSKSMGPQVKQVIPSAVHSVDPFVFLDHFGPMIKKPGEQGVPPHPHAGIATITYLFSGSNRHQDSYKHDQVVHPGDMAWMQAGKGIVHAEGMNEQRTEAENMHGLQFWISLPAKDKFIEPDFFYYPSAQLPTFVRNNVNINVLCGELFGERSPVQSLSPAYMYELKMPAMQEISIPLRKGDTAGLYLVEGSLEVDGRELMPFSMSSFDLDGESVDVKALKDSHFVLFGGTPLKEPIVGYASFVMNSEEQIRKVISDYQLGKMGTL